MDSMDGPSYGRICIALKFEVIQKRGSKSPSPMPAPASIRGSTKSSTPTSEAEGKRSASSEPPASAGANQRGSITSSTGTPSQSKMAAKSESPSETPDIALSPEHASDSSRTVPNTIDPSKRPNGSLVGTLHIQVKSAEGLPSTDTTGDTNPFVRCFLLPNTTLGGKRKSSVRERTLDPVWEEEFEYNLVKFDELVVQRVLEVSVWDRDRRGTNSFIGGLRLGPDTIGTNGVPDWMDSTGEEASQWERMLTSPGEWVVSWHTLRPSMTSLHAQLRARQKKDEAAPEEDDSTNPPDDTALPPLEDSEVSRVHLSIMLVWEWQSYFPLVQFACCMCTRAPLRVVFRKETFAM